MAPEDPDRLTADDAHILSVESAVITGHTLKLVVLEPGRRLDVDALRDSVHRRLPRQPRATQRVDVSGPDPRWVRDDDFDITHHVRRREVDDIGTRSDLWRALGPLMAEHLDHRRPLWTFDLLGPLDDGREAIAVRIHHAMADGITALRFLDALLWDPHDAPAGAAPHAGAPAHRESWITEAAHLPAALVRELGHRGSASPFDRPITANRELAFTVAPLAELKAIGASRPSRATVNDVLLAVVAGGLRSWIGGSAIAPRLRAQIPVSLHHRDEGTAGLGNRDSFLNIDLPIDEENPLARLDRIRAETAERKSLDDADELYDFFHALGRINRLGDAVRHFANSASEFSLAVSNVPGPRGPVGVAGRQVERLFSSSEPALHHALRVSAISCGGTVGIGLCTDPLALPNIAELAEAIECSHAELRSAAIG